MEKRPLKFIDIGGHRVKVVGMSQQQLVDKFVEFGGDDNGTGLCGIYIGPDQTIVTDKDVSNEEFFSTLFHEAIEAIHSIYELELSHIQISVLGEALFQAFKPTLLKGGK